MDRMPEAKTVTQAFETDLPARILFVSIYPELSQIVSELAEEMQLPIDIIEGGILHNGHLYAKEHQDRYDVIISQAGTVYAIQKVVNLPVISVKLTVRDFLKAFEEAGKKDQDLVLIGYKGDSHKDLETLFHTMFGGKAKSYTYQHRDDFNAILQQMHNFKNHSIIGFGGCVEAYAREHKIPYTIIRSNREHIREALLSAKNILDLHIKDKMRSRRLNSILNYSREGIIAVDSTGLITICNIAAKRMLNLKHKPLTQMNLNSARSPQLLKRLYGDGSFIFNQLMVLGDKKYMVSRVPTRFRSEQHETVITFQEFVYIQKMEAQGRAQLGAKGLFAKYHFEDIIAKSESMKNVMIKARHFSKTLASIFIEGETGTGKELFAQSIHNSSPCKHGPFVAINCAALPENLLESELFGYEEGAFTGAKKGGKAGLFELAHNGTIFLDEISETSLNIQGRLLRVLQEKEIMRVGGEKVVNINTRILAASNKNIYQLVQNGQFRNDLYFRLNLLTLDIPPLRQREKDIPFLANYFYQLFAEQYKREITAISPATMRMLLEYSWPGNVRELENCMERSVILSEAPKTINECLRESLALLVSRHQEILSPSINSNSIMVEIGSMQNMQQQIIDRMLELYDGNKSRVAERLGVSRVTVWKKCREQGTETLPGIN